MDDPPQEMKLFIIEAISVERNNPAGIKVAFCGEVVERLLCLPCRHDPEQK